MRLCKYFLIVALAFFCTLTCCAQDTAEYVYRDSTLIMADSVNKATAVEEQKDNYIKKIVVLDTAQRNKQLGLVNDSAESLKNDPAFAYAKNLDSLLKALQAKQQKAPVDTTGRTGPSWLERFFSSTVTKTFFWSLAIIFIGFILYKLFFTEGIFQRKSTTNKVNVVQEAEDNLSPTTDYYNLIAQSVANNNYRLATRYHYLQALQKLAARGAIQFTADKTNYQYLAELYGKPYYNNFAALTLNYEYAWYGSFQITDTMYSKIQNNFTAFNNQLYY